MFSCLFCASGYFNNMSSSLRFRHCSAFVYPSTAAGSKGKAAPPSSSTIVDLAAIPKNVDSIGHFLPRVRVNPPTYTYPQDHKWAAKRPPPPRPPYLFEGARWPSSSAAEDATPAPTRGTGPMPPDEAFVNLHVHRANGEFLRVRPG